MVKTNVQFCRRQLHKIASHGLFLTVIRAIKQLAFVVVEGMRA